MIVDELFPEKGRLVLTANGREFVERLGVVSSSQISYQLKVDNSGILNCVLAG